MKSDFEKLHQDVKDKGIACVACALGLRDTGRIKNWIIRKKIPKEFSLSVKNYLSNKKEKK